MMQIAIASILKDDYFKRLANKEKRFLLQHINNDQLTDAKDFDNVLNLRFPIEDNPEDEYFDDYLSSLNKFLSAADVLRKQYDIHSQQCVMEKSKGLSQLLNDDEDEAMSNDEEEDDEIIKINAVQDENEEVVIFKKNNGPTIRIGTTGIGSCLAVALIGKNNKNRTVAAVGHFISADVDKAMIKKMMKELCKDYHVDKNTLKLYLVGGCINTLDTNIDLIREIFNMQIPFNFAFSLSNGEEYRDDATFLISNDEGPIKVQFEIYEKPPELQLTSNARMFAQHQAANNQAKGKRKTNSSADKDDDEESRPTHKQKIEPKEEAAAAATSSQKRKR